MRSRRTLGLALTIALLLSGLAISSAPAQTASQGTRQIPSSGTASFAAAAQGSDAIQSPEFPGGAGGEAADADGGDGPAGVVNRSDSSRPGHGASANSGKKAKSNPELNLSFDGLNFRQQRLANGGNQFSVEPPDQGLCAGNGYVLESVNDVLQVFDSAGNPVSGVVDLNTFYGYPAAINRTTGVAGPFVTDPSCFFDAPTQRWFQVVLTLDTFPSGDFTGTNHIDIAVSQTANPLNGWVIYRLPVQDDGTQGTPNHACAPGPAAVPPTNPNACIGDYPHIGADQYGFYVTTNEYDLFGPNFHGAQIYAFSKAALAANNAVVNVVQLDTAGAVAGNPGFTVWPAESPADQYATDQHGTEYFLSSMAAEEANNTTGTDHRLALWALTNTASLAGGSPSVQLSNTILNVNPYAVPPKSAQKAGPTPLRDCINDTTIATPFGPGCWQLFFVAEPRHNEVESPLDSNDSRMQQVFYANGKLWGALDTGVHVGSADQAGIAWYIIKPKVSGAGVSGSVDLQGYLAVANNNVIYPAIAVTPSGRGVMAFTLVGADNYPTAAYAGIDAKVGVGDIHIAAAGVGPQDGFSGYNAFAANGVARPRWGDYGAAVVDGKSIWIASEYIAQSCTLAQYLSAPIGSCGGTRASLGNWATRISKVTP